MLAFSSLELQRRAEVQPRARIFVELADFGTIRSRSANQMEAYDS